ncbi:MAG: tyrosine-type recombinase/integrase, partial [Lachnospiraceae bacterium]|nr:tyrosine-type recombinase/integrase [Lachnospiraceae bacterium]
VREALIEEKTRQEENGIKCSICVDGYTDFVFLAVNRKPFDYKKLNHRLDRISEAIDNEIKSKGSIYGLTSFPHVHSHMLRHTFATRMREAGADIKATADIMGHHEIDITLNTYTDASEDFKRKEILLLDSTTYA